MTSPTKDPTFPREYVRQAMRAVTGRSDFEPSLQDALYFAALALYEARTALYRVQCLEEGRWPERLTTNEAVKLTGMSKSTIKRMIKSGLIASEKIGGKRLIERASLENRMKLNLVYAL